jgi:general stress protein CsbA
MSDKNPFGFEDEIGKSIEKVNKGIARAAMGTKAAMRWIVNILALIAIILLRLVEADFLFVSIWKSITINAFLLSLINFIAYLNSGDMGDAQGRKNEVFLSANEEYEKTKTRLTSKGLLVKLPTWCTKWSKTELENARRRLFESCVITYEDYINKSYAQMDKKEMTRQGLSKPVIKVILNANKMRHIDLSPSMLIDNTEKSKRPRRALGKQPQTKRIEGDFLKLFFIVFSLVFSCAIVFTTYATIDLASIAGAVLSVLLLCYNIFSGYMNRYNLIAINAVEYIKDRTQYLEEFEKSCETEDK